MFFVSSITPGQRHELNIDMSGVPTRAELLYIMFSLFSATSDQNILFNTKQITTLYDIPR